MTKTTPDLSQTFSELKALLQQYKGKLKPKADTDKTYDLWSFKELEVFGKKRTEMYFAGLIVGTADVSLHYMPIYAQPELKKSVPERILKLLKGKSCFHIKTTDPELLADLKTMLDRGYAEYEKWGWI